MPGLRTQAEFGVWSKSWVVPVTGPVCQVRWQGMMPNPRCASSSLGDIPVPWGHPRNIPRTKNSQTRMIAWFPENIPNIPEIPTPFGIPGIRLSHTYIYISKVKFNVSL